MDFYKILQRSFEEFADNVMGPEAPDSIEELDQLIQTYMLALKPSIAYALEEAIAHVVSDIQDAEEDVEPEEQEEPTLDNDIEHLRSMLFELRDYAFRFRGANNALLRKFACTILALISKNTDGAMLPIPEEQLATMGEALSKVYELVNTGREDPKKEEIKRIVLEATPGLEEPPEHVFPDIPAPIDYTEVDATANEEGTSE